MVLQDVNDTTPEGFGDDPAPNDNDQYTSMSSSGSGMRFDSSTLPHSIPILGTFMGFSGSTVRLKTEITLKYAERKLGRQLNSEEAQALAYHIYKLEQTKSYYAAAGAAGGAYRAYTTMAKNRYPFYQPKPESINPNQFAFIKGPMAPFARHAWRFSLYLVVAGQMGSIIGQMIAQPIAAVNTSKDPKLEQFGTELKAASATEQTQTRARGQEIQNRRREFERQTRDRNGMGPSPQGQWGKQPPPSAQQAAEDDMSPTAGNEPWGTQPTSSGSWDTFSSEAQNAPQQQSARQQTQSLPSQQQPTRPPPTSSSSSPFDDDASPTGGMFQDEVSQTQQQNQEQGRPGESTWDRLRRGGAPIPGQRPPVQQQSRRAEPAKQEASDSYSFLEGDEERKRERERAQQEFDANMERERQGRDFSGGEGEGEGGRKW